MPRLHPLADSRIPLCDWNNRARSLFLVNKQQFINFVLSGCARPEDDTCGVELGGRPFAFTSATLTATRAVTTLVGASTQFELTSGELHLLPLSPYRHFRTPFGNLPYRITLKSGKVLEKLICQLPTYPIAKLGSNITVRLGFSSLVTPKGDDSDIGPERHSILLCGIQVALGKLALDFQPNTAVPHTKFPEFVHHLRQSLTEYGATWGSDIFFVYEVVGLEAHATHRLHDPAAASDALESAFIHSHLSLPSILGGCGGTWYVGVALNLSSGRCLLWSASAHSKLLHLLGNVELREAQKLVASPTGSYERHIVSHLPDAAGCIAVLSDEAAGSTGVRTWVLSHNHKVAPFDRVSGQDVLSGRVIDAFADACGRYREAARSAPVDLRAEGMVPVQSAASFLANVPLRALKDTFFDLGLEEFWSLKSLRMLGMKMAVQSQLSRYPNRRLDPRCLLLSAGITFLANSIDSTAGLPRLHLRNCHYFLPSAELDSVRQCDVLFPACRTGDCAPHSLLGIIHLLPLAIFEPAINSKPFSTNLALETLLGCTMKDVVLQVRTSTLPISATGWQDGSAVLPPWSPQPWYHQLEWAYYCPDDGVSLPSPAMDAPDLDVALGLPPTFTPIWYSFIASVLQSIPSRIPNSRNGGSTAAFCIIPAEQLANPPMRTLQNLRLSDIFDEVQWRFVKDQEELLGVFDSHFPDKGWHSEDPPFQTRAYYPQWVSLIHELTETEVAEIKCGLFRLYRMLCWIPYGDGGAWETRVDTTFHRFGGVDQRFPAPKVLILRGEPTWE